MIIDEKKLSEDMLALASELRQFADRIEQGDWQWPECFSWAGKRRDKKPVVVSVKTEAEIDARSDQLAKEYLGRMEARLKGASPDMLDQAQVLRQTANDLEAGKIGLDEVTSVSRAFSYACGLDYGYQRFMKDRREKLF